MSNPITPDPVVPPSNPADASLISISDSALPSPKLSREQELLRIEAPLPPPDYGNITSIEPIPHTPYIGFHSDAGKVHTVHRAQLMERVVELYKSLDNDTQSSITHAGMDRSTWLMVKSFQAILKSGRMQGLAFNSPATRQFERNILALEKRWKHKKDPQGA